MNKQQLRDKMKQLRMSMTDVEVQQASDVIQQEAIEYITENKPIKVHCYTAIVDNKEVKTDEIIEFLKESTFVETLHSFKKIDNEWKNVSLIDNSEHELTQYDLIIIPMLAGDKAGNRLGYGYGFYDKFLYKQPKAIKIGLCYQENLRNTIPIEKYDVCMDVVIKP